MLIIVEGPDGSGKTTLCDSLKNAGYTVFRRIKSDKNFTYTEFKELQRSRKLYLLDRAILTPWAYRLLDGKRLNSDDFSFIEAIALLRDSPVIYCNTDKSYEYSMRRGEDNITSEIAAKELRQIYEYIVKTLLLYNVTTVFKYDFEKQSVEDVINFIKEVQ